MSETIQLGKILIPGDFIYPIGTVFHNIDKVQNLSRKLSDGKINLAADYDIQKALDEICKEGSKITNNEIKDILKVIWSLKNIRILLKGTTRQITSQEGGGLLNFLK